MSDNQNLLDADWDKLSPEKKAALQALVTKLDMAKVYKGAEGAMGAGGPEGQKAYLGIAANGGLPQEQLTALARFRQYNLNQASDPNWQGPPQAPITGPAAPDISTLPNKRYGMTEEQDQRSSVDNRYAMLAKPEQKPVAVPAERDFKAGTYSIASLPEAVPETDEKATGQSLLQMIMSLAQGKK